MKRWTKRLFCVGFSFLFAFLCIGYAELSDTLTITGTAEVSEPQEVYITDIVSTTGTVNDSNILPYTLIDSSVTLGSSATSAVTMTVSVKNNTGVKYGFNAIRYTSEAYSNAEIIVTTDMTRKTVDKNGNVTDEGTVIEPGEIITFIATFSYKDGKVANNPTLESLINYEFLPWDDITADTDLGLANDVLGKFENILNNADSPTSYNDLLTQMGKQQEADRYYDDYIANFDEAYVGDVELITELFGSDILYVNLDGEDVEVRVMIKKKNVTSAYNGDEFVLYMTTHTLNRDDAEVEGSWFRTYYARPIYAAVFAQTTVDGKTEWVQVGDMYTGRGRINGYDGSYNGEGSFDTETWRSTVKYGSANSGSTIEQIISAN